MTRLLPIALAGALLAFPAANAAQFRAKTELVSIYATVQDRETRLVPDLKQEDFVVTDNGKEQPITVFSNDVTPFSVVVMLDRSGSMMPHHFRVRDAASLFVSHLLPEDKARIGSFGDYFGNRVVISPPEFSSTHTELLEVLRTPVRVGQGSPVYIAIDHSIAALSSRAGRRVVLIFSDGHDRPPVKSLTPVMLNDLQTRIRQTEVMVYAIGFSETEARFDGPPKIIKPHKSLRTLADESGGGYFEVTESDNLSDRFKRVAEELHRQYVIGFVPPVADGKVHNLKVRVKRPDLTVRAKQTYLAPGK